MRSDLQTLALARLADARTLFAAGRYDAAYYLAGFSIECALKARIAKPIKRSSFPDKKLADRAHTHSLKNLLSVAGLEEDFARAPASVRTNWFVAFEWTVDVRYDFGTTADKCDAFLQAITGDGGILPWLKQRW